jgi:hypothetical protein
MTHVSLDYSYFTTVHNKLSSFSRATSSLSIHASLFSNLKSCVRGVAVRVAALGSAIVGSGMCACGVAPVEMFLLALRISKERVQPLKPILKAEWAFLKTILIGLGGCFGAIFSPGVVYETLRVNEKLYTSIAEALCEIPENIQTISPSCGQNSAICSLGNWRQELTECLARTLPGQIQGRDQNLRCFMNFDLQLYKDSLRVMLLSHFPLREVEIAFDEAPAPLPPVTPKLLLPRIIEFKNGVQDVHLGVPLPQDATLKQKIHALFYECVREVKEGLIREKIYNASELDGLICSPYEAILDLATCNFLLKWYVNGSSCFVQLDGKLVELNKDNSVWNMYKVISSFLVQFDDLEEQELVEPLLYHKTELNISSLESKKLADIYQRIVRLRFSFAEVRLKDLSREYSRYKIGKLFGF